MTSPVQRRSRSYIKSFVDVRDERLKAARDEDLE